MPDVTLLFICDQSGRKRQDRAQAPEKSNAEGAFHGVHLKSCWMDALSTATGLIVSGVQRTAPAENLPQVAQT